MTTNPEQVPTTWTTADETFFRAVEGVLSPTYTAGAGVLLSSYDSDPEATGAAQVAVSSTPSRAPTTKTEQASPTSAKAPR
jgi:hypothetical protein